MLKQEDYTHHISGQFNAELDALRNFMLEMGGKVEQQLASAIAALIAMDSGQAELIINRDHEVNQMEMSIDEQCATILARRQPAASDLRLIVAIIKVNTDLERIGDEAAKVALQAMRLSEAGHSPSSFLGIRHIGTCVAEMLRRALDAFARLDAEAAVDVVRSDRVVDQEYGNALRSLMTFMMEDPRAIGSIINEMWALRSLERIGDHASNIAEHVIYLVRGMDVRHGRLEELRE
ncbi:MAG: phosphate signaling complex protein PhoU [Halioglobus sp.]|nr:phosphate signaling complex protein PhoU [Halioglobus sp.]